MSGTCKKSLKPLIALNGVLLVVIAALAWFMFVPPAAVARIPDFGMPGLAGGDFGPDNFAEEKFVLNIFASWCVPCRAEHEVLMTLSRDHGIPVYGIALMDKPEDTKAFLAELGNPYRAVGSDLGGLMPKALGLAGVPASIVVGPGLVIENMIQMPLTMESAQAEILPYFPKD